MELNLFYQNQQINLGIPANTFNLSFLKKLFSPEILSRVLTNSNKERLSQFLPKNDIDLLNDPQKLSNLLLNTTTKFGTPIKNFYKKYSHNFFTINYQKNIELMNQENFIDFMQKKHITFIQLQNLLSNIQKSQTNNNPEINPSVLINTHINNNNNTENVTTTFDMHSELASSGYSSLEVDKESKHSLSRKNSGNIGNNPEETNDVNNSKMKDKENNYINSINKSGSKNKLTNDLNNSYAIDQLDENDSFIDRNILKSDRFKYVKKNKIQITIKPRTKEEIQSFREQEKERYKYPHKPWEYTLSNGNVAIVAPLFSSQKAMIVKARDHELLKNERPPYITLLALVRDAAARLENGVGTRLDICDLLKDSQYINENISESKINNIVSGALDRLHYQKDPCVKYDSHHKLWIYLHRNRNLDYPGWKKIKNNEEINIVSESNENKSNKNENSNIVIEDLEDSNNKQEEIIEVDDAKDSEPFEGKNVVKIHNDSSEVTPPSPNLIEFNEKIYSNQKKKIKSSLLGKKRSKK